MPNFLFEPWQEVKPYAKSLGTLNVKHSVATVLATQFSESFKSRYPSDAGHALDEVAFIRKAEDSLPSLMTGLRLTDLRSYWYWITMYTLTVVFLGVQWWVIYSLDSENNVLSVARSLFGIEAGILLAASLVVTIVELIERTDDYNLPDVKYLKVEFLHMIPVVVASLGLLFINLFLVTNSGMSRSPFLPSLLAVALVVISLPRENSRLTLSITVFALMVVLYPLVSDSTIPFLTINVEGNSDWDSLGLANMMNGATFVNSTASVILLRMIGNHRLGS